MDSTLPAAIARDHRIAEAEAVRRLRSLYPQRGVRRRGSPNARWHSPRTRAPRLRERSAPSRFCAITACRAARASR